jgi:predicted PurR-regulated permease PerM
MTLAAAVAAPQERAASQRPASTRISVSTRTMWQFVGVVLITLAAIWAIDQARGVVSMLVISWSFSLALVPGVDYFHRKRGWKRGAAVGFIYIAGLVAVILMVVVLIPAITQIAQEIGANGTKWLTNIDDFVYSTFNVHIVSESAAKDATVTTEEFLSQYSDNLAGAASGLVSSGIGLAFNLLTIATFTFYLTVAFPTLERSLLSWFKPNTQERLGWTIDQSVVQVGGYLYSRLLLTLINGTGFFITMVAVGVSVGLALPLAVFGGFVSEFIPQIGTYIGGAIPILLTLLVVGLVPALIVFAYVLIYQQIENYYLSPKISAHTMEINGGLAFGSALVGGALFGPMGAFMALPVAAMIFAFITNFRKGNVVVYKSVYTETDDDDADKATAQPEITADPATS